MAGKDSTQAKIPALTVDDSLVSLEKLQIQMKVRLPHSAREPGQIILPALNSSRSQSPSPKFSGNASRSSNDPQFLKNRYLNSPSLARRLHCETPPNLSPPTIPNAKSYLLEPLDLSEDLGLKCLDRSKSSSAIDLRLPKFAQSPSCDRKVGSPAGQRKPDPMPHRLSVPSEFLEVKRSTSAAGLLDRQKLMPMLLPK